MYKALIDSSTDDMISDFDEICDNCGLTLGSHKATGDGLYPKDYCPGHEGRMDWENGHVLCLLVLARLRK
jgi:hypothetical protein